jgi:NADH dehydrogenase FAD-containing subunit
VQDRALEKSGVHAVRAGRILGRNLRAAVAGQALARWRPQRNTLALIGTGDGRAIAVRGFLAAEGRWAWQLKRYLDRRFVRGFNDLYNSL